MRFQGRIENWNEAKGFGFVRPNGGGDRAFVHISSVTNKSHRPTSGDLISYEVQNSSKGLSAVNALYVGEKTQIERTSFFTIMLSVLIPVLIGGFVIHVLYIRITHPNSTIAASIYKATVARNTLNENARFTCEQKTHCSQMTSCAEAFFYQEKCGASEMDGDRDGIPCEQQHCN
jgi:cold shock CspA family protein